MKMILVVKTNVLYVTPKQRPVKINVWKRSIWNPQGNF